MTIEELLNTITAEVNDGDADMASRVMLDVAGRWTGVKEIRTDVDGWTLFIESED